MPLILRRENIYNACAPKSEALLFRAIMPIPQLPLHLHVDPPPSPSDGKISLDRLVLQQIEALISQHVPGMSVSFSIASVDVVCGGYTNK